jgi:holo-[acyl-carrier protein] synthase
VIRGIGVDIVEITRVREVSDNWGDRFLRRVFTPGELQHCLAKVNPYQHLAARFAAKEAVSKALATGWAGDFRWTDVEVVNDPAGKPHIAFHGRLREQLASTTVHLSLSHADTHVVAMALIEDTTS